MTETGKHSHNLKGSPFRREQTKAQRFDTYATITCFRCYPSRHNFAHTGPTMPAIRGTNNVEKSKRNSVIDLTVDSDNNTAGPANRLLEDDIIGLLTDDEDDPPTIEVLTTWYLCARSWIIDHAFCPPFLLTGIYPSTRATNGSEKQRPLAERKRGPEGAVNFS